MIFFIKKNLTIEKKMFFFKDKILTHVISVDDSQFIKEQSLISQCDNKRTTCFKPYLLKKRFQLKIQIVNQHIWICLAELQHSQNVSTIISDSFRLEYELRNVFSEILSNLH
jgi:hypothetical protein